MNTYNFSNLGLYTLILLNVVLAIITILKLEKIKKRTKRQNLITFTILFFFPILGSMLYLLHYYSSKANFTSNLRSIYSEFSNDL